MGRLLPLGSSAGPAEHAGSVGPARRGRRTDRPSEARGDGHPPASPAAVETGQGDRDARPPQPRAGDRGRWAGRTGGHRVRSVRRADGPTDPRGHARRGAATARRLPARRKSRPRGRALPRARAPEPASGAAAPAAGPLSAEAIAELVATLDPRPDYDVVGLLTPTISADDLTDAGATWAIDGPSGPAESIADVRTRVESGPPRAQPGRCGG